MMPSYQQKVSAKALRRRNKTENALIAINRTISNLGFEKRERVYVKKKKKERKKERKKLLSFSHSTLERP